MPRLCLPRKLRVEAPGQDLPPWKEANASGGIVASLDSWSAAGAAIRGSHLHHGRFGVRWKSSDGEITGNRISARYMEISPLEYFMEGPLRLVNITVADNTFTACAAAPTWFAKTVCDVHTRLPLGYWRKWVRWGGGTGGVCQAAAVGASQLDAEACRHISVVRNNVSRVGSAGDTLVDDRVSENPRRTGFLRRLV
jgi:hypothetical protein